MARITVQEPIPEGSVENTEPSATPAAEVSPTPAPAELEVISDTPTPESPALSEQPTPLIPHQAAPAKSRLNYKLITITGLALVLAIVGFVIFLVKDRQNLQQQLNDKPATLGQTTDEAQGLTREVGQFMELPTDETPTIATVSDAGKVRTQSFFANSQNGDKVLLFSKAGKAILYRPSTKKIIEVAPINLNTTEDTPTSPSQTSPPAANTNRR